MSQLSSLVCDKTSMIFENQSSSKCTAESHNSNITKSQVFDAQVKSNTDKSAYPFCSRNSKTPIKSPDYNQSSNSKQKYSFLERMREQLEFRKHFLTQCEVTDERSLMVEHPQKAQAFAQLQNSRISALFKKLHVPEQAHLPDLGMHVQKDTDIDKNELYSSIYSIPYEQLMPPLTSGESSPAVSDDEDYDYKKKISNPKISNKPAKDTRLEDLLEYLIDSSLITIERDTPKRDGLQGGWGDITEILLFNVSLDLSLSELINIYSDRIQLISRQSQTKNKIISTAECFKSCRTLYYQGKYSLLITAWSPRQAQLAFYDCANNKALWKQHLGESLQMFRVTENMLKSHQKLHLIQSEESNFSSCINEEKYSQQTPSSTAARGETTQESWVPLVLRNMPLHFDKSIISKILSRVGISQQTILSIEEPIFLNSKMHSMVIFTNVEAAIQGIKMLPAELKDIPQFKVNLHPDYDKQAWNQLKSQVSDCGDSNAALSSSSSSYTSLNFCNAASCFYPKKYNCANPTSSLKPHINRQFLEDISLIHTQFKQRRPAYIIATLQEEQEDDHKKLSQRSTTPVSYAHEKNNHQDNETNEPSPSFLSPSIVFPVAQPPESLQQEHQFGQTKIKSQEKVCNQESNKEQLTGDGERRQENHTIPVGQSNDSASSSSSKLLRRKINKYKDTKIIEDEDQKYEEHEGGKYPQQQGLKVQEVKKAQTKKGKQIILTKEQFEEVKKQQQLTPIKEEIPKDLQSNEARYGGTTTSGERWRNFGLASKTDSHSNRFNISKFDAKDQHNATAQEVQLVQLEVEQLIDEEYSTLEQSKSTIKAFDEGYQEIQQRQHNWYDQNTLLRKHELPEQEQTLDRRLTTKKNRKVQEKKQITLSRSRSRSKSARDNSEKEQSEHEDHLEIARNSRNIQDTSFKTNLNQETTLNEPKDTSISSINIAHPTRMTRSKLNVSSTSQNNGNQNVRQAKQWSFENLENGFANTRSERRQRREQAQILEGIQQRKNSDNIKSNKCKIESFSNTSQEISRIDNDSSVSQHDNHLEEEQAEIKQQEQKQQQKQQVPQNSRKLRNNNKDVQDTDRERGRVVWNKTEVSSTGRKKITLEKNNKVESQDVHNRNIKRAKSRSNEDDFKEQSKSKFVVVEEEGESLMDQEQSSPSHSRHKDSSDTCSKIEKDVGHHSQEFRIIQNDLNTNVIQIVRIQHGMEQKDTKKGLNSLNKDTKGHMTLFEKLNQQGKRSVENEKNIEMEKQSCSNEIAKHASQKNNSQEARNDNSQDNNCSKVNKLPGNIDNNSEKPSTKEYDLQNDEKENNYLSPKQFAELSKHAQHEKESSNQAQSEENNKSSSKKKIASVNLKKLIESQLHSNSVVRGEYGWVDPLPVNPSKKESHKLILSPSKQLLSRAGETVNAKKKMKDHDDNHKKLNSLVSNEGDILNKKDERDNNSEGFQNPLAFLLSKASEKEDIRQEDIEEETHEKSMVQENKDHQEGGLRQKSAQHQEQKEEQEGLIWEEVQVNSWEQQKSQEKHRQEEELESFKNNSKDEQFGNQNEANTGDAMQDNIDKLIPSEKIQQDEQDYSEQSSESSSPMLRKKSLSKGKQLYYSKLRDESCLNITQYLEESQGDEQRQRHSHNDIEHEGQQAESISENENRRQQNDRSNKDALDEDNFQKKGYQRWVNGVKCWSNNSNQQQSRDSRQGYSSGYFRKDNQSYNNREFSENNNSNFRRRDGKNFRDNYSRKDDQDRRNDYRLDTNRFNHRNNNRRDYFQNQNDRNRNRRYDDNHHSRGHSHCEERSRSRIKHGDISRYENEGQKRSSSRDQNGKTSRSNSRHIRDDKIDLSDVNFDY